MLRRDRTLLMFQTFRCQMRQQYTTSPLRDARLEDDAANGASVHNLPVVNASVLPAVCAEHDSLTVKHVSSIGVIAKPTITTYMHTVSTGDSGMIMNCSQSKPQIRMQLMQSPANGTPSPGQRQTQKCSSPMRRTRIKPQQLRHLMMSEICLDVKRLFAWMKRS